MMRLTMAAIILLMTLSVEARTEGEKSGCAAVDIVSREEWRARPSVREGFMTMPINHVIIQHTVTHFTKTHANCVRNIQSIQDFHLDERGWWDIAYNFLICGDGRVYEGRGWNGTGAHSINFNTQSLGIAFLGNFNKDEPTKVMLDATLNLIDCGVQKGFLTPSREIHGHRDVACTESPGQKLYDVIRQWKYYKGGRLALYNCEVLQKPILNKEILNE